jgi:uncharacterized membrane protein
MKCPACGGENSDDAVFCANPACHKALGEFRYVAEEIERETRPHEKIADSVTGFIGHPYFLVVHTLWFALWVAVNTGLFMIARQFDAYPFSLLGIVLSIEAIFITGFVLISQNRQSTHADKRAELDYEVNVRTFRDIQQIKAILGRLEERIDKVERVVTDT